MGTPTGRGKGLIVLKTWGVTTTIREGVTGGGSEDPASPTGYSRMSCRQSSEKKAGAVLNRLNLFLRSCRLGTKLLPPPAMCAAAPNPPKTVRLPDRPRSQTNRATTDGVRDRAVPRRLTPDVDSGRRWHLPVSHRGRGHTWPPFFSRHQRSAASIRARPTPGHECGSDQVAGHSCWDGDSAAQPYRSWDAGGSRRADEGCGYCPLSVAAAGTVLTRAGDYTQWGTRPSCLPPGWGPAGGRRPRESGPQAEIWSRPRTSPGLACGPRQAKVREAGGGGVPTADKKLWGRGDARY